MQLESDSFLEPASGELDSPHFDDERTLLSARPVVPLADVLKSRKRHYFGIAGIAAGIGFLAICVSTAALIQFSRIESKSQAGSNQKIQVSDPSPATRSEIGSVGVPVDSSPNESNESNSEPEPRHPAVAAAVTRRDEKPSVARSARRNVQPAVLSVPRFHPNDNDWDSFDEQERRELRRNARRAERRAQRDAERMRVADDPLFRVTDLFEGTRRP